MAGLQVLEDHYRARGFRVLAFYSNNFGKQGGSDEQIAEVTKKYRVEYDQFAVGPVVGDDARATFKWLLSHDNPGPMEGAVTPKWNFFKYLISRSGQLVAAFDTPTYPGDDPTAPAWIDCVMTKAIEAELAK